MSVLITSTVDPSKRYTRHDHVGRLARSSVPAHHTGEPYGKKSSMGSKNRQRRFRGNLKSSVTRSIAPKRVALENRRYLPKRLLLPQSSRRGRRRRRKATSTQRVPRPTQSNLGATDRIKADFRHLREHLWRFSLPIELFLPSALPVCRHRAPCQPSNVIVTSVSLHGSTVLVIKTDMTYTVTHQTTHVLPPAGPQNALDESHKKPSAQQAGRSNTLLARCRRAHVARGRRWRS